MKLKKKELLLVGLTLFSMFFGAGNLIFPPFLGEQAGQASWLAALGFILSAVGLPILGVIAVAKSGGLTNLASRVHPYFASLFTLLIYLSIGPCLAIPRTASTSYEMTIAPFAGEYATSGLQLIYSLIFFGIALYLALNPEKLSDRLGKVLCPLLLSLIIIIFVGSFFTKVQELTIPVGSYAQSQFVQGFLDGYQTMDTIAALNFGIIIALNIRSKGITDSREVVATTMKAGFIAGVCLASVYVILIIIGSISGTLNGHHINGAQTLMAFVQYLFKDTGLVILGAIFFIACLNTCIGLICCCSEYFHELMPKVSYKKWAFVFAFISMLISNVGLDMILKVSVPILNLLYPLAIVLIVLAFIDPWICRYEYIYPITILFTGVGSILELLPLIGIDFSFLHMIPLYDYSLGWLIFSLVGIFIGFVYHKNT